MTFAVVDPKRRFIRATVSLVVTGAIAAALVNHARPVAAQQPTFQTTVNFVDVDVTVADAQGHFVSGLTADDFEVFEDGKPQTIQTFSYIELPVERPDRYRFAGQPVPDDVRSNRDVSSGRVYIILLDDLNVAPLRTNIVRRHAREFIERQFGPHDLAAVVVTSGRKDAAQEFTSDPALLLRAVDHFVGQRLQSAEMQRIDDYYQSLTRSGSDQSDPTDPITRNQSFDPSNLERGQRAVGVLNTLRSLAEFLESVQRTPEGAALVQRRHRLSDGRGIQLTERQRDLRGHPRRHLGCRAGQRQYLRARSTRSHRHDDRFRREHEVGRSRCHGHRPQQAGWHTRERNPGVARRDAPHAGQPAYAGGGHGRLRGCRYELV